MARIHINSIEMLDENPLENFVKLKPKQHNINSNSDKLKLSYKSKKVFRFDRTNIDINI